MDLLKQVALLGHHQGAGGTGALLALVGTKVGAPKAAGAGEPQWALAGVPMWHYVYRVPPVGHARPKWQCVAPRGQGGTAAMLPLVAVMGDLPQTAGAGEPQ